MEDSRHSEDRFQQIFNLCDGDNDGYIDVKHFVELAKDHFGAGVTNEELTGIINILDPEGRGVINFTNFCEGIKQIIEIHNSVRTNSFSEETLVPLDIAGDLSVLETQKDTYSSSSQNTYAEYDFSGFEELSGLNVTGTDHSLRNIPVLPLTEVDGHPLIIPSAWEDEEDSAISGRSSLNNESSHREIVDEDNYEDFGEAESEADTSNQGRISTRRITPAAHASQLQRSNNNSQASFRRSSFGSDEIFEDIDGNFQDVHGRLKFLEEQIQRLTQVQTETNSKQFKLKDDNTVLVEKIHALEEQLRDTEVRAAERLSEEHKKHQEYMARQERDKTEQVDYITQRLHRIEKQYEELKEEAPRLHAEIARLRSEKMDIQERLLEKQESYNLLYDDHVKLKADCNKQESLRQKETQATEQLLDEMGKELEELRCYKIEHEGRSPSGSITELPGRYSELQNEIHKLKEENKHLHDSNEELNAQLLNHCLGEGTSLTRPSQGQSMAEELEHLTKEELLEQLRMERDVNDRLKQYVDKIIIAVLEKSPSLLEITNR